MTEEQNFENREEKCNCICKSKGFRKFVIVALGTFVGVYCALALFTAIHRPPMPPCPCNCPMMRPPIEMQYRHFKAHRGDFDKIKAPQADAQRTPFEAPRPEVNK